MPEPVPTVQENQEVQPVTEAPRDPSPASIQDHHEILHETPEPRILSPDKFSGQEYQDEMVENDEVAIEMAPEQLAQPVTELPNPVLDQPRPRRNAKPNSKYSPEVYDLSYVGGKQRTRSRRSIRRTGM